MCVCVCVCVCVCCVYVYVYIIHIGNTKHFACVGTSNLSNKPMTVLIYKTYHLIISTSNVSSCFVAFHIQRNLLTGKIFTDLTLS